MPTMTRRNVLKATGAAAVGAALAGTRIAATATPVDDAYAFEVNPFSLGVASGDATPRSVVLWTRLAPEPFDLRSGMRDAPQVVPVWWSISRRVPAEHDAPAVRHGGVVACRRDEGYSVHIDVDQADGGGRLEPFGEYTYTFAVPRAGGGMWTTSGVTRTAPHPQADVDARFVVMGCQSHGLFNPLHPIGHEHLRQRTLGEVDAGPLPHFGVFLGDYIYEFRGNWATGDDATALDKVCRTLNTYRQRYAWYRSRPALQHFHRTHPTFAVPDDHEFWNDLYGGTTGRHRRFNCALQAFWENMPMRARPVDTMVGNGPNRESKGSLRLHDRVRWGRNLDLVLADVRQHRRSDGSSMLGDRQLDDVVDWMRDDRATWTALGSGQPMAVFGQRGIEWCEFPADRDAMTAAMAERGNRISLASDLHIGMVNAVRRHDDTTSDFVATEFVCPPASSGGNAKWRDLIHTGEPTDASGTTVTRSTFVDGDTPQRGYLQCNVTASEWVSEFFVGNDVGRPDGQVWSAGRYRVQSGRVGAHRVA